MYIFPASRDKTRGYQRDIHEIGGKESQRLCRMFDLREAVWTVKDVYSTQVLKMLFNQCGTLAIDQLTNLAITFQTALARNGE